jgi:hypothetical protein
VCDLLPHCQGDRLATVTILHLDLPGSARVADRVRVLAVVSAAVDMGMGFGCPHSALGPEF